jgi:AAA15 family ATPase/GTPase
MDKLQWIEIQNFRGIKYCKLEDFADLNVFIGKNNTGKSTILEGLYLNLLCEYSEDAFGCRIDYFLDFFRKEPFELLKNKRKRAFDDYWAYKKNFPIKIESNISELMISRDCIISRQHQTKNVVLLYPELCLDPSYPLHVREHIADFGLEAIQKIAKALTEKLSLEEELGYIEERKGDIYFVFEKKSVPFENVGDGLKIAFVVFAICYYLTDGIILIEEPEAHQHPKSLEFICDALIDASKSNQIFVSTHSLEFLKMILEKAKAKNVSLNVYKLLELKDGMLKHKLYTRDVAYASIKEIGRDLRL